MLLEKQHRRLGPGAGRQRLHLLYGLSAILRASRKHAGPKDRYGKIWAPDVLLVCSAICGTRAVAEHGSRRFSAHDAAAERLQPLSAALVMSLRPEFPAQIDKTLKLWAAEGVYSREQLSAIEAGRLPSPNGSLTEASALVGGCRT
jgi:hypothetical protein